MSSDSVVISSVAFPDPATLALVADVQYHEPYTSAALNRKLRGILREGFYSGFIPRAGGGLNLLITSVNAEDNTGSASVNIGDDYQITIRQQKDITLQLSAGTKFAIVLKGVYALGSDTYQVNTNSNIQAAEITAKTYADDYQLGNGELLICTVNVPAGATELTEDMIDSTGKKIATVGIELSNDYESEEEKKAATPKAVKDGITAHEAKPDPHQQYMESKNNLSEIADAGAAAIAEAQKNIGLEFSDSYESDDQTKAATPKAVKDGIANHEQKDNPHDQYLMIANCLKEIADKGDAAIQKVLDNLGLGEAAKRNVGTDSNQIPDMSAFTLEGSVPQGSATGYVKVNIAGIRIIAGTVSIPFTNPSTAPAGTAVTGVFTLPSSFPNRLLTVVGCGGDMAMLNSGYFSCATNGNGADGRSKFAWTYRAIGNNLSSGATFANFLAIGI